MTKAGLVSPTREAQSFATPPNLHRTDRQTNLMKIASCQVLGLLLAGVSLASAQDGSVRVVASSGTAAPGQSGNFNLFAEPVLNGSGTVAFLGYSTAGKAVYVTSGTSLVNVATTGQTAPVITGTFDSFTAPVLNESGVVAFWGANVNTVGQAIYTGSGGTLTTIAVAATTGQTFNSFPTAISLSDTGAVALEALIGINPVTSDGIYKGSGGSLTTIATTAQTAPGNGGTFSTFQAPMLNNVGATAFTATTTTGQGIYTSLGSTQIAVATTSTVAPGIGGNFTSFSNPALNDNNTVAFKGSSSGGTGIFTGAGGTLSTIATTATLAPGLTGNFTLFSEPSLNNAGMVAFAGRASLSGASAWGMFSATGGTVQAVAVTGQAAPTIGGTFSNFAGTSPFNKKPPALNNFGAIAFLGTSNNGKIGLFLGDTQQLITAAYTGQIIAGSTITGLTFTAGSDRGGAAQFNDNGQVTYLAALANGTTSVQLFTPTLHFRNSVSGPWATRANWTIGILPASVHDVVIDSAAALTVTGPMLPTVVKSLAVNGSGANVSELTLQSTGTITAPGGASTGVSGRIGGTGKLVANLTSAGTIAPGVGSSTGSINVTGNVTLQSTAHLALDLGGLVRKTGYDFLNVSGQLTLGGSLDVALLRGFTPLTGSSFDLFDATSVTGAFGSILLPSLPGGFTWNTTLLPTTGVISIAGVTVNPTTYTLAASASAATIHAGGSATITATVTNTGAAGTDTLNYSGLNVSASPAGGTVSGVTLALTNPALANGNTAQSGTAIFSSSNAGTYTLTPLVTSATNGALGTAATNAGLTSTTVAVFSGAAKWVVTGTSAWGNGANANWTDTAVASVHAAPGTFGGGFAGTDSATFDAAGSGTVNLDGATPSLAGITFSGGSHTIAKGTGSGVLTLKNDTGSATITASSGSQSITAPVALSSNVIATVTSAADTLTMSGGIDGAGKTLTKAGAGTLTLSGLLTFSTLNANAGVTNINSALGAGTTLNANGTVNINVSQTLDALNIGGGSGLAGDDPWATGSAVVPEPGSVGLLLTGALGFLTRRRRALAA